MVKSLYVSFMIYYATQNDVCYWHVVVYKISKIYVSVFIYLNYDFFSIPDGITYVEDPDVP
jgi:hypothetical protein